MSVSPSVRTVSSWRQIPCQHHLCMSSSTHSGLAQCRGCRARRGDFQAGLLFDMGCGWSQKVPALPFTFSFHFILTLIFHLRQKELSSWHLPGGGPFPSLVPLRSLSCFIYLFPFITTAHSHPPRDNHSNLLTVYLFCVFAKWYCFVYLCFNLGNLCSFFLLALCP